MSSYDKENKYYRVIYEDDDSEEYTVSELVELIDESKMEDTSIAQENIGEGKRRNASKARKSTGGRTARARNGRFARRKSSLNKEPVQRTAGKVRLPAKSF